MSKYQTAPRSFSHTRPRVHCRDYGPCIRPCTWPCLRPVARVHSCGSVYGPCIRPRGKHGRDGRVHGCIHRVHGRVRKVCTVFTASVHNHVRKHSRVRRPCTAHGPRSRLFETNYPCSRPVNATRVHGRSKDSLYTRQYGPCTQAVKGLCTRAMLTGTRNTLPVFLARERGPSLRATFTSRDHG